MFRPGRSALYPSGGQRRSRVGQGVEHGVRASFQRPAIGGLDGPPWVGDTGTFERRRVLQMNARAWFNQALDVEARFHRTKTAAGRQRHGRDAIDAVMAAASLGYADAFLTLGSYYQYGAFGIIQARADLAEHWLRLAAARSSGGCSRWAPC